MCRHGYPTKLTKRDKYAGHETKKRDGWVNNLQVTIWARIIARRKQYKKPGKSVSIKENQRDREADGERTIIRGS